MRRAPLLLAALLSVSCSGPAKPAPVALPPPQPPAEASDKLHQELVELARSGPTEQQFPQADSVVIRSQDDIALAADGTVTRHHHHIVRILDPQRGKAKFADVHIRYDRDRQVLTIEGARTANADGKISEASADEIDDILPQRIRDAAIYSNVRERVVTFPAVDRGSVLELEYTLVTRPSGDSPMGGEISLGAWDPINEVVATVTVPVAAPLAYRVENLSLEPAEARDDAAGTRTLTFRARNLPDRQPEMQMPADPAVLPRLVYSFVPSWEEVVAQISGQFLQAALPSPLPPAVVAKARELTAKDKNAEEQVASLLRFVAHEIRAIDIPLGWGGYVPNPPDTVLANRYGDARDKVALFLAMCAALDIDARPVFARGRGVPVLEAVPTLGQFDQLLAQVAIGGNQLWLNPAYPFAQIDVSATGQDSHVLLLDVRGGALEYRPALSPDSSTYTLHKTLSINPRGDLDARFRLEPSGWFASMAQQLLRSRKGEYMDQFFQGAAVDVAPSAESVKHTVGDLESVVGPVVISQQVAARGYAQAQGRFRVIELPPAPFDPSMFAPPVGQQKREYPLWVGPPRTEKIELSIKLPAGWKVAFRPPDLETEAPGIRYSSKCKAERRVVTCHRVLTLDREQVKPSDYASFRKALTQTGEYDQRVLLLRR